MEMEKLVVEFEVEKVQERDYGYEEKFLKFRGEPIPYKAVIKDGQLFAIVSRGYRLVENERIEEIAKKIAERNGWQVSTIKSNTRIHVILEDENGDGIVIHNSVDGTFALRVDALVRVDSAKAVFINRVEKVYGKHTKNLTNLVNNLEGVVEVIYNTVQTYRDFINALGNYRAKDFIKAISELQELLPQKYVKHTVAMVEYGFESEEVTLKEVYESIAKKIWSAEVDMRTKIHRFDMLNRFMANIVRMAEVLGY